MFMSERIIVCDGKVVVWAAQLIFIVSQIVLVAEFFGGGKPCDGVTDKK